MNTNRRLAVAALIAAGLLWGTTVPLSKLALEWLPTGWLTVTRFGLAAAVLLAVIQRKRSALRAARTPKVLASGTFGYGGSVILQNAGIARTSVIHAALLIGAVPVLVAVIAALWHRTVARPAAWAGFAVSLAGVGLVTAGGGGGGATLAGDGLVMASLLLSAAFTVGQVRVLRGRDPVAVTAVQFLGAAAGALAFTVITEGAPPAPASPGPVLAVAALVAGGTLLPFTLFAFGQSRVSAEIAGAFLNLEPLVGAVVGVMAFGDPVGIVQVGGGAAILAGIGLSSLPLLTGGRAGPRPARGEAGDGAVRGAGRPERAVPLAVPGTGSTTSLSQRRAPDDVAATTTRLEPDDAAATTTRLEREPLAARRRFPRRVPRAVPYKRKGAGRRRERDLSRPRGSGRGARRARPRRWRPARLARR
jgi:O-acetylserine/cysteine efflux transporter